MSRPGSSGGHGQALAEVLREAKRLYGALVPVLVPPFLLTFILLRELLLVVVVAEDFKPLTLLLVATLVQAVIPAFVGSLLVASALPVLAGKAARLRDGWAGLADRRPAIYRSAMWSSGLALFATITLGPVGIMIQPMVLGPPLLVHEIVLRNHGLTRAWERTREMMAADSRQLVFLLAIPAAIGILLTTFLRALGGVAGGSTGLARGVLYFAAQGALLGVALPFVAALGLVLYEEMASALGGDEAR